MVRAIMIVEMAGRPAEHLTETLEKHVGVLDKIDDIIVHSIKVSAPKKIEISQSNDRIGAEDMFTAFAECDLECDTFARLSETMFDFMPSSVEVIEPASVSLGMSEATDLLNNISGRMHRYDEIAKIASIRLKQMAAQLQVAQMALMKMDSEKILVKKTKKKSSVKKKISTKKKSSKK